MQNKKGSFVNYVI